MTFAIGIRYLCGFAMATHPTDRQRPEWPPHPDRIFQALAAAHFETDGGPEEYQALRQLSALGCPALRVSGHQERRPVTSYVPANGNSAAEVSSEGGPLLPHTWVLKRPGAARSFPVAIPDEDTVHLIWAETGLPEASRRALAGLCRKVTAVGHSASIVQMWVEDHPPETPTHLPTQRLGAPYRLRVPGPGRLEQLTALSPNLRPAPAGWCGYERSEAGSRSPAEDRGSAFAPDLLILRRETGRALGLESTLLVTEALRGAVMSGCSEQPPPDWVSGHDGPGGPPSRKLHLAFLALAHIGREHADGRLLGVALVVPKEIEPADQRRCLSRFLYDDQGEPRLVQLRFGRLGAWDVRLEDREDRPLTLRPEVWTATGSVPSSRCWASVTPIVLERYPKAPGDAERTVSQGCVRVGLPEPERVVVTPAPPFVGVPHARAFPPMLSGPQGGRRFHTHALIEFSEPVSGPLLLGAGRFRGYGLCRPWGEAGR